MSYIFLYGFSLPVIFLLLFCNLTKRLYKYVLEVDVLKISILFILSKPGMFSVFGLEKYPGRHFFNHLMPLV